MLWDENLSERERDILRLVATGASNKVIAEQLGISPNTVKVHLKNVFEKIGAASRTEAAYFYHQHLPGEQVSVSTPGGTSPSPGAPTAWGKGLLWGFLIMAILLAAVYFSVPGLRIPGFGIGYPLAPARQVAVSTRWQALAPLPEGRAGMAAAVHENAIYIISGESPPGTTGSLLRYDTRRGRWEERAPIPLPVSHVSAALLEEKIYIPGGRLADGTITSRMQVYDPRQDKWEEGLALPRCISGYALAVLDGKIYLFGGWDGKNYLSSVYQYSLERAEWIELAALPRPLAYAGAVALQNKIILFGGLDDQGALRETLAFYPRRAGAAQAWEELEPLPAGRYAMGAAGLVNQVYLVGGRGQTENEPLPPLQFSFQSNHWQPFEDPPQPGGEFPVLLPVETRLALIGGRVDKSLSPQHQVYQAIYTLLIPMMESQ